MADLGQVIADQSDSTAEELGDSVEQILSGCWRLGAALYFLSVWRWRVSYFHELNDTTAEYHKSGFEARLREGYTQVTASIPQAVGGRVRKMLTNTFRKAFCSPTADHGRVLPKQGVLIILFCGGVTAGSPGQGGGGTVIAQANVATGQATVIYMGGAYLESRKLTATAATNIGLLKGLKFCRQQGWSAVHVVGDNDMVIRNYATRRAPRGNKLQGAYWKTRRMAVAVTVATWRSVQREHNATVRTLANMVRTTQQPMEWSDSMANKDGDRWGAIRNMATRDVAHWLTEWLATGSPQHATETV